MTTETEPGAADLELGLSRHLPAPPEEVFDAYTDADRQKIWFSILDEDPESSRSRSTCGPAANRLRCGGRVRTCSFRETQTLIEIDRPHRMVTESVGATQTA